jgi:predicted AlkP superfamily pyrophosphatase or phosphodiesterase
MNRGKSGPWALALCASFLTPLVLASESGHPDIRLVLQITVDGLRSDLVSRGEGRYGEGGFRYLVNNGAVFANSHYQHANTETIVGHATLATGAHPSVHGMTGNVWYDAETGELAYNIEDPDSPILPVRAGQQRGDQVDPAQKHSRTQGRSPKTLLAETLADKLLSYTAGKSRVFAVSGKDRSTVAMAGKGGKAFWMSTDSGDFVTSAWYYDTYPDWAAHWNAARKASRYAGTEWRLLHDKDSYLLSSRDDRPYETDLRGFGRTFPHRFGEAGNKLLYTQVIASPEGDVLLADFAEALVTNEQLGLGPATDFLSVSFSGVDAVNHFFGPASLESEDMILRLDRTLAGFLAFIDERVGFDKTLIVLSADHGIAELPEYMAERGIKTGRLTPDVILAAVDRISKARFGTEGLVRFYYRPYLYLDRERIGQTGLPFDEAREILAEALTLEPGIHIAATRRLLESWPDRELFTRIRNNFHPVRSGDIYVVQEPYWFNFDKGPVTGMHGSPWNYDTHVPIIFAGPGIGARTIYRAVQPADVAPSIAALLDMSPPASAQGAVLPELFADTQSLD